MSKYHNIKTKCLSGHIHDSRKEADYCNRLLSDKQCGRILGYEIQVPFVLAGGIKHVVDFLVWVNPERWEVHEVKGVRTAEWRLKYKLFKVAYPMYEYRIIGTERKAKRRKAWQEKIRSNQKVQVFR